MSLARAYRIPNCDPALQCGELGPCLCGPRGRNGHRRPRGCQGSVIHPRHQVPALALDSFVSLEACGGHHFPATIAADRLEKKVRSEDTASIPRGSASWARACECVLLAKSGETEPPWSDHIHVSNSELSSGFDDCGGSKLERRSSKGCSTIWRARVVDCRQLGVPGDRDYCGGQSARLEYFFSEGNHPQAVRATGQPSNEPTCT
jgi:hypothetical protein